MEKLSDKDKKGIYIIGALVVLSIVVGVSALYANSIIPDDEYCRGNVVDRSHHEVIIDMTDSLDSGLTAGIENYLKRFYSKEYVQDRLTIYILDKKNFINRTQAIPFSQFSYCIPGPPEEVSYWFENKQMAQERVNNFKKLLQSVGDTIKQSEPANRSPIFEMIDSVSESFDDKNEVKLHVISDMLHNNNFYSQYLGNLGFEEFKNNKAGYYNTIRPSLSGVDVDILYIQRKEEQDLQSIKHEEFWKQYFMDNLVKSVTLKRI